MPKAIDLTGQKFNMLTVLKRKRENGRTYYYCKCDCGNEKWMRDDRVKEAKSCGCLSQKMQFKASDISGQKRGRLTIIRPTADRDGENGALIWECLCDCGNTCYISSSDLARNRVSSCGCLGKERSQKNIQKAVAVHIEEHIVEGTNIPAISRTTPKSNNTSGVTGVGWDKRRKKWSATIRFKNKVYYLGRYENKEDAIKARKEAEEKYFKPMLEKIRGD